MTTCRRKLEVQGVKKCRRDHPLRCFTLGGHAERLQRYQQRIGARTVRQSKGTTAQVQRDGAFHTLLGTCAHLGLSTCKLPALGLFARNPYPAGPYRASGVSCPRCSCSLPIGFVARPSALLRFSPQPHHSFSIARDFWISGVHENGLSPFLQVCFTYHPLLGS
ncbi:hypothetical protein M758_11G039900 [Ceratodon purpureus]|nr:hypothetical protein M758_11G039900 [Ceratodon purpureus]